MTTCWLLAILEAEWIWVHCGMDDGGVEGPGEGSRGCSFVPVYTNGPLSDQGSPVRLSAPMARPSSDENLPTNKPLVCRPLRGAISRPTPDRWRRYLTVVFIMPNKIHLHKRLK